MEGQPSGISAAPRLWVVWFQSIWHRSGPKCARYCRWRVVDDNLPVSKPSPIRFSRGWVEQESLNHVPSTFPSRWQKRRHLWRLDLSNDDSASLTTCKGSVNTASLLCPLVEHRAKLKLRRRCWAHQECTRLADLENRHKLKKSVERLANN